MITPQQIDLWLSTQTEHQRLEFKEAKTQLDNRRLYKYCVAIANEGGGHLILGVSNAKPRKIVGSAAVNNPVEMVSRVFQAVGFRVDIDEVKHLDGRIVVFRIPGRPKGTAYAYEGAYLMRIGEELKPMSEDQLRNIFAEGQPDWLELPALTEASAQDVVQLLDTQAFFDLLKLPYPSDRNGVLDRLKFEGLIHEKSGNFEIINLAAVLFAKDLRNFESVFRKAARIIVYEGSDKLQTKSDITESKGYAVGFRSFVEQVMSLLPQNEIVENALRVESKLLPEVVIRELLANALIHQDFEERGMSPMVEVYADRVEISNPGKPIVPVERFIDGYQSRNERLADLMRRLGICEEKSSGIDRVVRAAETHQLPAPDFQVSFKRTVVILYGSRSFREMDRSDRVRACYQHCSLQWVLRNQMTNQSLRERFKLPSGSTASVSQVIQATIEDGLIKPDPNMPEKSKKLARYLPIWA
jgi:predicted HTH transcriptional regulator